MNYYLVLVIALLGIRWLLTSTSDILNLKNLSTSVPTDFKDIYDEKKYSLSQRYLYDRTILGLIEATFMLLITLAFIIFGGFGLLTDIARSISDYMVLQGWIFIGILLFLSILLNLPFKVYNTFVIEERYDFNRTTVKTFVLDIVKSLILTAVLGIPIFTLILLFFEHLTLAWLWAWIALSIIQLFLAFIAPVVILPLFNKFTPLEDDELKQSIEEYAAKQDYKISGIFKIDGSRRSTKGNAFFTGFGKTKRIALFDTLLDKFRISELLTILAHEVGHSKLGHIRKNILFSLASSLLMFFLLSLFIRQPGLYEAFGVGGTPIYAGIVFFLFIYTPFSMILGVIGKSISRKYEYQADSFAVQTTGKPEAMINALKKLTVDNLGNLTPHPMKVSLEYSHPPVLQRIKAIKDLDSN